MPITIFILVLLAGLATAADIPLDATLYASDPNSKWASPDNTFSFSFIAGHASTTTTVAAIAYGDITIWTAGGPSIPSIPQPSSGSYSRETSSSSHPRPPVLQTFIWDMFLKLDNDGTLRLYSYARGSGTSTMSWAAVSDQCQVFGFCEDTGICSYNDNSPVCGCPSQIFHLIDQMDSRKGCERKVGLKDCQGNETMLELDHSKFLTFPPELSSQVFYLGLDPCRLNCLVGPCTVSTSFSDGSGICLLKSSDLLAATNRLQFQAPHL